MKSHEFLRIMEEIGIVLKLSQYTITHYIFLYQKFKNSDNIVYKNEVFKKFKFNCKIWLDYCLRLYISFN